MTGWYRFPAVKIGSEWLAHAEYFKDSRPVAEGESVGTIRVAKHPDRAVAEAMLETELS